MGNALGLTLLVVVVTLGLGHLTVHASRQEFLSATAVVAAVGASMVLARRFQQAARSTGGRSAKRPFWQGKLSVSKP